MKIASTHSTGSAEQFREWLKSEMESRSWTQPDLARAIGVTKGTVNKWLLSDNKPNQRRPSYDSLRRLAELFGVDLQRVLAMAGVDDPRDDDNLSPLARNVMWMIPRIDDRLLAVIEPQIRALINPRTQQQVLDGMRNLDETELESRHGSGRGEDSTTMRAAGGRAPQGTTPN